MCVCVCTYNKNVSVTDFVKSQGMTKLSSTNLLESLVDNIWFIGLHVSIPLSFYCTHKPFSWLPC